eukprot:m.33303 g.33303  ORF g.33303 m.33303 type:complete len:366 (+) comp10872_c0_seq1:72-1169(+)
MDAFSAAITAVMGTERFLAAITSAAAVGLVGLLPLLLLPFSTYNTQTSQSSFVLRLMLGASCGGLLANTLFHILPECFEGKFESIDLSSSPNTTTEIHQRNEVSSHKIWAMALPVPGICMFAGIMSFFVLEKIAVMLEQLHDANATEGEKKHESNNTNNDQVVNDANNRGDDGKRTAEHRSEPHQNTSAVQEDNKDKRVYLPNASEAHRHAIFYLNLLVNGLDNAMHGAAISAAYCSSFQTGLLTTVAIIAHEIPHELGDYAILLRSGVTWQTAVSCQLLTSSLCLSGACLGLYMDLSATSNTIMPFTVGGFLYIALASLMPDLIEQPCGGRLLSWAWIWDVLSILAGASVVILTLGFHHAQEHY